MMMEVEWSALGARAGAASGLGNLPGEELKFRAITSPDLLANKRTKQQLRDRLFSSEPWSARHIHLITINSED
jgi:hypothetical protein